MNPLDRFTDLQKQGFMRSANAPPKKVGKPAAPIVACDACLNWHRLGKHTADLVTRRANLKRATP